MANASCYRIIRFYKSGQKPRTIKTGLTLQEAQEHCSDPETSSSTATTTYALARTTRRGAWFDGYDLMRGVKDPEPNNPEIDAWNKRVEEEERT